MDRVVIAQKDNFYCNSESSENSFEGDNNDDFYKVRKGEWSYLRKECETFDLEQFYNTYVERVQRSFLSIFFVLQTLISVTHMILIATTNSNDAPVNPDIICYTFSILLIWITLFPAFKEDLIRKYPWLPFAVSAIAVSTLVITDLIVPLHHAIHNFTKPALRPCYASHVLFVIYIFLPLMNNWHAFVLGLATTLSYLIEMRFITYRLEDQKYIRLLSEAIYLACINLFGIYFRLINEVAIRRQFLDRRNCVQQNLVLKFERNQEKELLLSILPEHTAEKMEKDIRSMIEIIRKEENRYVANLNSIILDQPRNLRTKKQWRMINKMYVEQHNDVSILYADVVNYTQMTTQLPVKTLVETLHELFVKFDEASKEFNVLRIKFLGDCYYCVSGVPIKNKRHAKNCVDLGLRMIKDIRDVRQSRDLNIDMRIGIHSGSIISGVIGACKWQYDIWSSDVNIANKMESTGEPGKVHVTAQTLELLEGEYIFEDGTEKAKEEPTLKKNNIQTFLICPQPFAENNYLNSQEDFTNNRVSVGGVKRRTIHNRKSKILDTPVQRNFMQNSMEQFREIMNQTKEEMARELEKMPIGKFQFNKLFSSSKFQERRETQSDMERNPKLSKISTLLMCFENRSWEMKFLKEPDLMFKYGVLMSFIVYCTIFGIQILNNPSGWVFWTIIGISGLLLVLFVLITWFKKIWDILMPLSEDDLFKVIPPKSKIVQHLYNLSFATINNSYLRTLIYLTTVAILFVCSLIHLRECTTEYIEANDNGNSLCLNPWSVTHCLILAVCMSFLFVRIYFLLKLVIGILILLFYAWIIFDEVSYMYVDSASVNPAIDPKTAHFYTILIATVIFHLIDRQAEYISRVDFSWKQHLLKKHEEAEVTKNTNSILVQNILPAHVADIYINHQLKNEFHNEQYEDVAVMFATITNFDITTGTNENEEGVLRVLNEIICDFDEKLLSYNGPQKIEKIKVAGWTYMAACGLEPSRSDSTSTAYCGKRSLGSGNRISLIGGRRSFVPVEATTSVDNNTRSSPRQSDNVVIVLAEFALELMRVLKKFCDEFFIETKSGRLRVGISHGRVMAGVVGSSKPLYDIWGNAVNMASRMDSTGISGKIQVTEDTAEVLKSFQFKCDYRDNIFVKGRGNIPTYFIDIDDALNFVKTESEDTKL